MNILSQAAAHLQNGDLLAAQQCYLHILKASPEHGLAQYGLGYIAQLQNQWPDAIAHFQNACELLPAQPQPLLGLANAFNQVFSEFDALTVLEFAHSKCTDNEQIKYTLTQQYLMMGKIDQATALIKYLLNSTNDELFAFACLDASKVDITLLTTEIIERCHSLALSISQGDTETSETNAFIRLQYTLGALAKHECAYDQAMQHWHLANAKQLEQCTYKVADMFTFFSASQNISANWLASVRHSLSAKDISNEVLSTEAPVKHDSLLPLIHRQEDVNNTVFVPLFIVGLPRTGSTLLEQKICSLSNQNTSIKSVGEVNYIATQCVEYLAAQTNAPYPECLQLISSEQAEQARAYYVNAILQHRLNADFIINKLPSNFQFLPLIYRLFPEAKVIHLKRNLQSTAASIYSNDFALAEPYFCDLTQMRDYFEMYNKTMRYFSSAFAEYIFELSYEDFVKNSETLLTQLATFIGISNTDDSAKLPKTKPAQTKLVSNGQNQVIKTLSAVQARQPIHVKSSILPKALAQHFEIFKED